MNLQETPASCERCEQAVENVTENTALPVLSMEIDVRRLSPPGNDTTNKDMRRLFRDSKVTEFLKNICALRNSNGGNLVIHFVGKEETDQYLGHFDELVEARLHAMIEDNSLYVDNYHRTWHDEFHDILVFNCNPSSRVSTVDFQTKVPLDFSILKPDARCIMNILSLEFDEVSPKLVDFGRPIHENRGTQLKAFKQVDPDMSTLDIAQVIWSELRLKEYITAFSKLREGGTYLCGIEEKKNMNIGTYSAKTSYATGIPLEKEHCEEVRAHLETKLKTDMLWIKPDGAVYEDNCRENFVQIQLKTQVGEENKECFVLQIDVSPVPGIVFSDKEGPRSYVLEDGRVVRLPVSEWFNKVRNVGTVQNTFSL